MKIRTLMGAAAALCTLAGAAMAQPANDNCSNAIAVSVPSVTTGTTVGGTIEAGPPQTCTTTYTGSAGVWYTLVGNGNTLTVDTCTGGSFDSKLHVYCSTNANPCSVVTALSCVGGNDDTSGCGTGTSSRVTFCSALGQTYYVLVSAFGATTTGSFTLTVTDGASCSTAVACGGTTAGACCNNTTQACTIVTSAAGCASGSTFQGIGTSCTYFSPCPGVGACCSSTGTCTVVLPANCTGTSTHLGVGTACLPTNPCTALLGACCNDTTGACTNVIASGCASGSTFQGAGTVCGVNLCPGTGACCSSTGTCTVTLPASCAGATQTFLGAGTPCLPTNPCTALLGACCSGTGTCSTTTTAGCAATSSFQGVGSTCTPTNPCTALVGACCTGTSCTVTFAPTGTPAGCASGVFQGLGTTCTPNPCSGACCTVGTSPTCTLTNPAGCLTPNVYKGIGSVCSPTPCPSTTGPANDECANAEVIPNGSLPATANGNNAAATTDPSPAVCASSSRDQWYTFTPTISQNYSVRTCGGLTGTLDTVLSVHTGCPTAAANNLVLPAPNCNDDGCSGVGASQIPSIALTSGTTYYIRVARFGTTGAGGPFTVTIDAITGTCCDATTGACTITTQVACGSGTWTFGGTCTTSTCPGACCNPDGSCVALASVTGCAGGGVFQGPGTICANVSCPIPSGACCANDGSCTVGLATACVSPSLFLGSMTTCNPDNTCSSATVGSCCNACGTVCTYVASSAACASGSTYTAGGVCSPSPCVSGGPANDNCSGATAVTVGANPGTNLCATTGFAVTPETQCGAATGAGGARDVWHVFIPTQSAAYTFNTCDATGFDSTLALYGNNTGTNVCPTAGTDPVRACNDDATCSFSGLRSEIANQLLFAGQTYYVRVAAWAGGTGEGPYVLNIVQGEAAGACCTGTSCEIVLASACPAADYQGDFSSCSPNPCLPADGACCCGAACIITAPGDCTGTNQVFSGSGSSCTPYSVTVPCCRGDFNKVGGITVQDIFDFLSAYFTPNICADANDSTAIGVQDIFDFLAAYFAGCP